MFFNPLTFLFMIIFFFSVLFFFVMVQINIIALAFVEIGIPSQYIFTALFATLFGSFINIPVKKIPQDTMIAEAWVSYFGFRHVVPVRRRKETVLAVNLGGAVFPTLLSIYLLFKTGLWGIAVVPTLFMTIVTFRLAQPVRGVGIALPAFVPPVLAAVVSVILAYDHAAVIAYISGTLGTLAGADLLNMKKIETLGAPVAAIGGAGTFDGIFLNGILAVLLAALLA
ncbi:MAG: DUF1614 domain-containing protein [Thermodesulfobacteriota bacterium]